MNNQNHPNADTGDQSNDSDDTSNSNSNNSHPDPPQPPPPPAGTSERAEIGIFERFMDSVLGLQHRTNNTQNDSQTTDGPAQTDATTESATTSNSNLISNLIEWTIPPRQGPDIHTSTTHVNDTSTPNVSLPTGPESEEARAIIITVNYVFSDENNPLNPNRSGSLVLSLPNNSSNRDPEFIQQLIRFATQMAYSSIISGLHKQKGITKKTFDSYPISDIDKLDSNKCVICFDEFTAFNNCEPQTDLDEESSRKRRKLDPKLQPPPVNDESTKIYLVDCEPSIEHTPIELPCHHTFGKSCLQEWLKDHVSCPLCRKNLADPADTPATNTRNLSMFLLPNGSTVTNLADPTNIGSRLRRVLRSGAGLQDGAEAGAEAGANEHGPLSHILGYLRRQRQPNDANQAPNDAPNAPNDAPTAAPNEASNTAPTDAPTDAPNPAGASSQGSQESNPTPDNSSEAAPEVNEHNENSSTRGDSINDGENPSQ